MTKPDDLSVKIILRSPHFVKPSAEPQILLTVSGIKGLNLIILFESVGRSDNVVTDANGALEAADVISKGSNED